MYNEYPDLIYEGLMYDLSNIEIVTESSEKKGIIQRLKIIIEKIIEKIRTLFKKIFGKSEKPNESSNTKKVEVPNINVDKAKRFIDEFDQNYKTISDQFYKLIDELKNKYSEFYRKGEQNVSKEEKKAFEDQIAEEMNEFQSKCAKLSTSAGLSLYSDSNIEIEVNEEIRKKANELMTEIKNKNIVSALENIKLDLAKADKISNELYNKEYTNANFGGYAALYSVNVVSLYSFYDTFLSKSLSFISSKILAYCNRILNS